MITKEQAGFFWAKVDVKTQGECWEWTAAKKPKGYGNVRINKKYLLAHRVAWELANFPIPDGFMVCHSCDNPSCCNPGHLFLGNARSNFTDMVRKGRAELRKNKAIGERNVNSKLNSDQVSEIRDMYSSGKNTQCQLAQKYGVSQPTIGCIIRRQTWRHV